MDKEKILEAIEEDAFIVAFLLFSSDENDEFEAGEDKFRWAGSFEQILSAAIPELKKKGLELIFGEEERVLINKIERKKITIKNEDVHKLSRGEPCIAVEYYENA